MTSIVFFPPSRPHLNCVPWATRVVGVPRHVTPVPLALAAPLTQTPPSTTPVPMVTTPSQAPPTAPHVLQATPVVIPVQTQWCHV